MTDEGKTPEGKSDVNLDNYIPKEDAQKQSAELTQQISALKGELDAAQMKLLDPGYLDYLEDKRPGAKKKAESKASDEGKNVDPELQAANEEVIELRETVRTLENSVRDVLAVQELGQARSKYNDFGDYEDQIKTFLQSAQKEYTFEEAYLLVKQSELQNAPPEDSKDKKGKVPFSSEKPSGSVPAESLDQKEFATVDEANKGTIDKLREKYPDLGDTI